MAKMVQGSLCPRCGEGTVRRIHRKSWMRRLPKSKYYHCTDCQTQFLTIFGWPIRLPDKPPAPNGDES
jgi:predicted RNA-binding Zn-ribbon protein involved in translation (DUF1610 family)